jgi:ABC-type branched-subunit amino acid transport system substrate-binding protein
MQKFWLLLVLVVFSFAENIAPEIDKEEGVSGKASIQAKDNTHISYIDSLEKAIQAADVRNVKIHMNNVMTNEWLDHKNQAYSLWRAFITGRHLSVAETFEWESAFQTDRYLSGSLIYLRGLKAEQEKRYDLAYHSFQESIEIFHPAPWKSESELRIAGLYNKRGKKTLFAMAPLSGSRKALGEELKRSVSLFISKGLLDTNQIKLKWIDTEADALVSVKKLKRATQDHRVAGVLGPVISSVAIATSSWLSGKYPEIPLVSPTANELGLSDLGSSIYQINQPLGLNGQILADNIKPCVSDVKVTIKSIALISSKKQMDRRELEEFSIRANSLGYEVSPIWEIDESEPNHRAIFDSMAVFYDKKIPDAIVVSVSTVGGASSMVRQIRFHKHEGQVLALGKGWQDKRLARLGSREVIGVIGVLDNDEVSPIRTKFELDFKAKFGTLPNRTQIAYLTYDALSLLNSLIKYEGLGKYYSANDGTFSKFRLNTHGSAERSELKKFSHGKFNSLTCN